MFRFRSLVLVSLGATSLTTPASAAAPSCIGYFPAGNFVWQISRQLAVDAGPYAVLYCESSEPYERICLVTTSVGNATIEIAEGSWRVAGEVLGLAFYGDDLDTSQPTCDDQGGPIPVVDFDAWSPPRTNALHIYGSGS